MGCNQTKPLVPHPPSLPTQATIVVPGGPVRSPSTSTTAQRREDGFTILFSHPHVPSSQQQAPADTGSTRTTVEPPLPRGPSAPPPRGDLFTSILPVCPLSHGQRVASHTPSPLNHSSSMIPGLSASSPTRPVPPRNTAETTELPQEDDSMQFTPVLSASELDLLCRDAFEEDAIPTEKEKPRTPQRPTSTNLPLRSRARIRDSRTPDQIGIRCEEKIQSVLEEGNGCAHQMTLTGRTCKALLIMERDPCRTLPPHYKEPLWHSTLTCFEGDRAWLLAEHIQEISLNEVIEQELDGSQDRTTLSISRHQRQISRALNASNMSLDSLLRLLRRPVKLQYVAKTATEATATPNPTPSVHKEVYALLAMTQDTETAHELTAVNQRAILCLRVGFRQVTKKTYEESSSLRLQNRRNITFFCPPDQHNRGAPEPTASPPSSPKSTL